MSEHLWWCTEGDGCACDPDVCTCDQRSCLVHGHEWPPLEPAAERSDPGWPA